MRDFLAWEYLPDALRGIEADGRYWAPLSRSAAHALTALITERGLSVVLLELPPEWELVLTSNDKTTDVLRDLALKRARLRAEGVEEDKLPR